MLGPSFTFRRWKGLPSKKIKLLQKSTSGSKTFPIWNVLSFLIYGKFIVLQVQWNLLVLYLGSYLLNLRHFKNSELRQLNLDKQNWKKSIPTRDNKAKEQCKASGHRNPQLLYSEDLNMKAKRFNCFSLIWNTIGYCYT